MDKSPDSSVITGNYFNKHETNNVLYRFLVNGYKKKLQALMKDLPVKNGLEIGSGEGFIIDYIREVRPEIRLVGSDISPALVQGSAKSQPYAAWNVFQGENLPFKDSSFDLVLACEVMEHLHAPSEVFAEIKRVARRYVLISVPQEPVWRVLNMMRMKYLRDFGNTPGHYQHWSVSGIEREVEKYLRIERVETAFPWTFVLARK
jgi:ubiquinone/menaquinone biosynthesis C-methylase UbiE